MLSRPIQPGIPIAASRRAAKAWHTTPHPGDAVTGAAGSFPQLGVGGSQTLLQVGVVGPQQEQLAEMECCGEPVARLLGGFGLLFSPEDSVLLVLLGAFPRDPQPRRIVVAGGGEASAVPAECHGVNPAGVPLEDGEGFTGFGVPQPGCLVVACRYEKSAVGAERHGANPVGVPLEDGEGLAGVGVPQPRRLVVARR